MERMVIIKKYLKNNRKKTLDKNRKKNFRIQSRQIRFTKRLNQIPNHIWESLELWNKLTKIFLK